MNKLQIQWLKTIKVHFLPMLPLLSSPSPDCLTQRSGLMKPPTPGMLMVAIYVGEENLANHSLALTGSCLQVTPVTFAHNSFFFLILMYLLVKY